MVDPVPPTLVLLSAVVGLLVVGDDPILYDRSVYVALEISSCLLSPPYLSDAYTVAPVPVAAAVVAPAVVAAVLVVLLSCITEPEFNVSGSFLVTL